jgi:integrase
MRPLWKRWRKYAGEDVHWAGFFGQTRTADPLCRARTWFESALKDAKIVGFHWHDLRHTFASPLRQKGARLEDIAEEFRHNTLLMTKRYAHLRPTGLHDVVALLEQKPTRPKTDPKLVGEGTVVSQVTVQ